LAGGEGGRLHLSISHRKKIRRRGKDGEGGEGVRPYPKIKDNCSPNNTDAIRRVSFRPIREKRRKKAIGNAIRGPFSPKEES